MSEVLFTRFQLSDIAVQQSNIDVLDALHAILSDSASHMPTLQDGFLHQHSPYYARLWDLMHQPELHAIRYFLCILSA